MEEKNNVIDLTKYLKTKIEPSKLMAHIPKIEDRSEQLTKRSFAFAMDIVFISMIKTAINLGLAIFLDHVIDLVQMSFTQKYMLSKSIMYFDYFLTFAIFIGYFSVGFYSFDGKTFGKKLMKLVAVPNNYIDDPEEQDFQMTWRQALMRSFGYLGCYLSFGVLFALPFARKDRKSLSEIMSDTTVITEVELYKIFLFKSEHKEELTIDTESIQKAA